MKQICHNFSFFFRLGNAKSAGKRMLWLLCALILGTSCEEVIDPDLISAPPLLVVDGWLYPNASESRIILSKTAPFNSKEQNPKVSEAVVVVRESNGNSNLFRELLAEGTYKPLNPDFTILPFRQYTLEVNVEGIQYTASLNSRRTPIIDSLTSRTALNEPGLNDGKYVTFYFQEPLSIKDFYLWEVWKNGIKISSKDINILSDENINGSYIDIELPYTFRIGDQVIVRLHAISKEAFDYYESVRLLSESGSPAQAIPENPKSNLTANVPGQAVLGFFNATVPHSDTLLILE